MNAKEIHKKLNNMATKVIDEVKAGHDVYEAFKNTLATTCDIEEACRTCGMEAYVWDDWLTHDECARTFSVNVIGEDATINVMVTLWFWDCSLELNQQFELVPRDWTKPTQMLYAV